MPVYAWAMLVVGGMIVFGFPPVILATLLLELERAFGWPFFIAAKGGDPVLWQHLFWLFGHPEVYIIFLPAAGMVSMIIASMCRTPLVGYHLMVVALLGVASSASGCGRTTCSPPACRMSRRFFSAASMVVAIPSGIQVSSPGSPRLGKLAPRDTGRFLLAFIAIFTLGGLPDRRDGGDGLPSTGR